MGSCQLHSPWAIQRQPLLIAHTTCIAQGAGPSRTTAPLRGLLGATVLATHAPRTPDACHRQQEQPLSGPTLPEMLAQLQYAYASLYAAAVQLQQAHSKLMLMYELGRVTLLIPILCECNAAH